MNVVLAYGALGLIIGYILKQSLIPFILGRYGLLPCAKHWHYPLFEVVSLLCALLIALKYDAFSEIKFAILVLSFGLLVLAFIDAEYLILPDIILKPLWGLGFLLNSHIKGLVSLHESVLSSLFVCLILSLFAEVYYQVRGVVGLGRGDIKLLGALGAWFGFRGLFMILWVASVTGLIWALMSLYLKKDAYNTPIPFGPFLVYGAFCWLFVL